MLSPTSDVFDRDLGYLSWSKESNGGYILTLLGEDQEITYQPLLPLKQMHHEQYVMRFQLKLEIAKMFAVGLGPVQT